MSRRRLRKNTSEEMIAGLQDESFKEVSGSKYARYVATLINPVDHRLYDVIYGPSGLHIVAPMPSEEYTDLEKTVLSFGDGYLDTDEKAEVEEGRYTLELARSHTPSGVGKKGTGQGLMLYCGLALYAKAKYSLDGIYSSSQTRSQAATSWWRSQVQRGFADEDNKYVSAYTTVEVDLDNKIDSDDISSYDFESGGDAVEDIQITEVDPSVVSVSVTAEGRIEIQYITAEKVASSGYVIAWDTEDSDLNAIFENVGISQPVEVIMAIDLSTTSDPTLVENLLGDLEEAGVDSEQITKFLDGVPERLLKPLRRRIQPYVRQLELPRMDEYAANPKHSKAWEKFFGEAIHSN